MQRPLVHRCIAAVLLALVGSTGATVLGQEGQADREPPRIIGEIPMRLERVSTRGGKGVILTLFVGGIRQSIETGDTLRVIDPVTGKLLTTARVTADTRPAGRSGRVHLRVDVARPSTLERLGQIAAAANRGFPKALARRDKFVARHGAKIILVVPFEPEKGDDPANFVRVTNTANGKAAVGVREVGPHASFELRFDRPMDLATLRHVQMATAEPATADPATVATAMVVPIRVFAVDEGGQRFRFAPPLGLAFLPEMQKRAKAEKRAEAQKGGAPGPRRPHYHLRIAAGDDTVRSATGVKMARAFELPITLAADSEINLVGFPQFRAR